jgi:hypothetical protein
MDQSTKDLMLLGIDALKSGDTITARRMFLQVSRYAPDYQPVWLWLSDTAANDQERRSYLERCVEQNPDSRSGQIARKKLTRLAPTPAHQHNTLLPPFEPAQDATKQQPPFFIWAFLASVVLLIVLVLIWNISQLLVEEPEPEVGRQSVIVNTATPDPLQSLGGPTTAATPASTPTDNPTTTPQATYPQPATPQVIYPQPATPFAGQLADSYPQPPDRVTAEDDINPFGSEPSPSGGIGLDRQTWEAEYGAPEPTILETVFEYADGQYNVTFVEGHIAGLERVYDQPVSRMQAQEDMVQFLPTDSTYIETAEEMGITADVYNSPWLAEQFPGWFTDDPGVIAVLYAFTDTDEQVESYSILAGQIQ